MIISNNITRISSLDESDNIDMRMTDDPKIFMMLSSSIYEFKIRAIIRELSCNAIDAHKAAGNEEKFFVHLPTQLEPYFYVEDFGVGLDEQELRDVYTVYGESTKTKSNDMIGALGLGSKSPFSYTDIFEVRARKDGIERIYIVSKGEKFSFTKFSEKECDEPAGVRVKFDVRRDDFYEFKKEFTDVVKYFPYVPENNYGIDVKLIDSNEFISYSSAKNIEGTSFTCVMGGVGYTTQYFEEKFKYTMEKLGVSSSEIETILTLIKFKVPYSIFYEMGELEFMPSRERLALTPTCIQSIYSRLYSVYKEFYDEYMELRSQVETPYDILSLIEAYPFAATLKYDIRGNSVLGSSLKSFNSYSTKFVGTCDKIFAEYTNIIDVESDLEKKDLFVVQRQSRSRKARTSFRDYFRLFCYDDFSGKPTIVVLENDIPKRHNIIPKLVRDNYTEICENIGVDDVGSVFVFMKNSSTLLDAFNKFCDYYLFADTKVLKMSDVLKYEDVSDKTSTKRTPSRPKIKKTEVLATYFYKGNARRNRVDLDDGITTYYIEPRSYGDDYVMEKSDVFDPFILCRGDLKEVTDNHDIRVVVKNKQNGKKIEESGIKHLTSFVATNTKFIKDAYIGYKSYYSNYGSFSDKEMYFISLFNKFDGVLEFNKASNNQISIVPRHAIKPKLLNSIDFVSRYNLEKYIELDADLMYIKTIVNKYSKYLDAMQTYYISDDTKVVIDLIFDNLVEESDKK